jgi:hypothetical protein
VESGRTAGNFSANGNTPLRRTTAAALAEAAAALPRANQAPHTEATLFTPTVTRQSAPGRPPTPAGRTVPAQRSRTSRPGGTTPSNNGPARTAKPARSRRSPAETVALANRIKAERPSLTDNEIAAELGISTSRLRTVRREAANHTMAA